MPLSGGEENNSEEKPMKWRNCILILIVALILSIVNIFDYCRVAEQKKVAARKGLIVPIAAEQIGFFSIDNESETKIACVKRNDNKWAIVEPVVDFVDTDVLRDIFAFISFGRGELVPFADLKKCGLAKPLIRLNVSTKPGRPGESILFGNKTTDGKFIYVTRAFAEDKVFRVNYNLVSFIFKNTDLFRDRVMMDSRIAQAQKIILTGTPAGSVVFFSKCKRVEY